MIYSNDLKLTSYLHVIHHKFLLYKFGEQPSQVQGTLEYSLMMFNLKDHTQQTKYIIVSHIVYLAKRCNS